MLGYLSRFFYVLAAKKSSIFWMLLLFIVTSLLDALGIGLIGPFIGLATSPSLIVQNLWLNRAYTLLGTREVSQFIALLGLIVVAIFYIKSYLYFQVQRHIYKFAYTRQEKLRLRLMHAYLAAPYTFHLKTNTAVLIQTIINEAQSFCIGILLPLLLATANFVVLGALVMLLAITSLSATVSILGILLLAFSLYYFYKDKIVQWGKEGSESVKEMIRIVNHGMGGLKETKVIGCESYFEQQLDEQIRRFATVSSLATVFQFLPRIVLESLLITFVIGFTCIWQIFFSQSSQNLISILGVFAIASVRLMPAASQFMSAVGTLRNHVYTLDRLYLDLKELEKLGIDRQLVQEVAASNSRTAIGANKLVMPFKQQVVLDQVSYRYPGAAELALKDISLTIKQGQSIAFIGKSGAGKTTLADIILGLLMPNSGDIKVDGISIYNSNDLRSWQNLLGYIPQSIFLMDDTIERNVAFGVPDHLINPEKLARALEIAQLQELIGQLPDGIKTTVGERGTRLSGGQRQRIGIARALYHEREILILDEATAALDSETESLVSDAIQALGGTKTMIIIAHRLSTVEHCDRIYLIEQGRLVKSGSYDEVVLGKQASSVKLHTSDQQ